MKRAVWRAPVPLFHLFVRPAFALKIVLSIGRRPCLVNGHFLTSLDFDNISFHNDFADQNQAIMSYTISTLLIRNLHKVFGENDPTRRRAAIDEIFTEDCVFYDPMAATRSIASQARSRRLTLTFDISQLPSPRNWAMAGGSNGYRAAPVRRQLTPGLISSLPETAGLPPFISFSTNYPELLDSVVRRLVHVPEASGGSRAQILERFERGEFKSVHAAHCQRL